ncbi:MAG: hypothetical protein OEV40_28225, partial [Acidimicrobiia bacterium]|nr:hypothetical protein [Acidimicrobiia bacterium]
MEVEFGAIVGGSGGAVVRAGRLTVVVGDPRHPFAPDDTMPVDALALVDRLCRDDAWEFEDVAGALHAFVVEHDPHGVAAVLETDAEAMVFLFDAAEVIEFEAGADPALSQRVFKAEGRTGWTTELVAGPMISLGLQGSTGTLGWTALRSGAVAGDVAVMSLRQSSTTATRPPDLAPPAAAQTLDLAASATNGVTPEHLVGAEGSTGDGPTSTPADEDHDGSPSEDAEPLDDVADFDDETAFDNPPGSGEGERFLGGPAPGTLSADDGADRLDAAGPAAHDAEDGPELDVVDDENAPAHATAVVDPSQIGMTKVTQAGRGGPPHPSGFGPGPPSPPAAPPPGAPPFDAPPPGAPSTAAPQSWVASPPPPAPGPPAPTLDQPPPPGLDQPPPPGSD